ncbi:MAG: hypothetical protein KME46_35020 [Brasilonema angustatum HA4187-MV1]|nr:hypothetical protein [Brasilonema angustatum HA4187-MV1]
MARLSDKKSTRRLEVARQMLQVGKAAQRTGLATQAKPTCVGSNAQFFVSPRRRTLFV